jgi:DNA-binding transcriptional ArsR family regulator
LNKLLDSTADRSDDVDSLAGRRSGIAGGRAEGGSPNRPNLRLVSLVAAPANAEACVCDLTEPVGLSQPTVSHHLKILVDASVLDANSEESGPITGWCLRPLTSISQLLTQPTSA